MPSLVVSALLAGAVLVVVAVAVATSTGWRPGRSTGRGAANAEDGERGADEHLAAVGRAAGEAADRLDEGSGAGFENEVYRAWSEMTRHLEVAHPESSTPGEFADVAGGAGMARADVSELTSLFEEVRYGGREATPARETRAGGVLRRIEATYGGESA